MNELLPIIRRKRRPLLPVEAVQDQSPTPPAETTRTEPTQASTTTEPDTEDREHDEAS